VGRGAGVGSGRQPQAALTPPRSVTAPTPGSRDGAPRAPILRMTGARFASRGFDAAAGARRGGCLEPMGSPWTGRA
jgi:hypothetical protein